MPAMRVMRSGRAESTAARNSGVAVRGRDELLTSPTSSSPFAMARAWLHTPDRAAAVLRFVRGGVGLAMAVVARWSCSAWRFWAAKRSLRGLRRSALRASLAADPGRLSAAYHLLRLLARWHLMAARRRATRCPRGEASRSSLPGLACAAGPRPPKAGVAARSLACCANERRPGARETWRHTSPSCLTEPARARDPRGPAAREHGSVGNVGRCMLADRLRGRVLVAHGRRRPAASRCCPPRRAPWPVVARAAQTGSRASSNDAARMRAGWRLPGISGLWGSWPTP
jgi:hypothetical protein